MSEHDTTIEDEPLSAAEGGGQNRMKTLTLRDGTAVTEEQIRYAFDHGNAVLVHYRIDWGIGTGLSLDGNHYDTRDQGGSVWDEEWTSDPSTLYEALKAAEQG